MVLRAGEGYFGVIGEAYGEDFLESKIGCKRLMGLFLGHNNMAGQALGPLDSEDNLEKEPEWTTISIQ